MLFRGNARWTVKGAKEPIDLKFMQDWSVSYDHHENVGLVAARKSDDEDADFGVYWLLSWTTEKQIRELQTKLSALSKAEQLDLDERCHKQALAAFKESGPDNKNGNMSQFGNHYNRELGKCFILTEQEGTTGGTPYTNKILSDANEGRAYGVYMWMNPERKKFWEVPPSMCRLTLPSGEDVDCKSSDEFDSLVEDSFGLSGGTHY